MPVQVMKADHKPGSVALKCYSQLTSQNEINKEGSKPPAFKELQNSCINSFQQNIPHIFSQFSKKDFTILSFKIFRDFTFILSLKWKGLYQKTSLQLVVYKMSLVTSACGFLIFLLLRIFLICKSVLKQYTEMDVGGSCLVPNPLLILRLLRFLARRGLRVQTIGPSVVLSSDSPPYLSGSPEGSLFLKKSRHPPQPHTSVNRDEISGFPF